jgi:hypothetical protein
MGTDSISPLGAQASCPMPLTFHGAFLEILTQKPQILHGYLIRLTREYTDGGMDSRAEEE